MANMHSSTGNMPPRVFGGIAIDCEAAATGDALGILDLPGSLIGDLVTLPEVLIANHVDHNRVKADPDDGAGDGEDPNRVAGEAGRR